MREAYQLASNICLGKASLCVGPKLVLQVASVQTCEQRKEVEEGQIEFRFEN